MNKKIILFVTISTIFVLHIVFFRTPAKQSKGESSRSVFAKTTEKSGSYTNDHTGSNLLKTFGKTSLIFEENVGQADSKVKFLSRSNGYTLFLTPTKAILAFRIGAIIPTKYKNTLATNSISNTNDGLNTRHLLRLQLLGANPLPKMIGLDELRSKSNYFVGNDRNRWRTNVPHYSKVKYEGVYPGIDMVYYGNKGQLKYDFIVYPGADPDIIQLAFEGSKSLRIDKAGNLIFQIGGIELVQKSPMIYQYINGIKEEVPGNYLLLSQQCIGFQTGKYDAGYPLIIDPMLVYSTFLGGLQEDRARSVAVDDEKYAYVIGNTVSTDFPTKNAMQPDLVGFGSDIFILKLKPSGDEIVFSTYLGSTYEDAGRDISIDNMKNIFVTGYTYGTDFPIESAFQPSSGGETDAFVAKLSAAGNKLIYSSYLGGSSTEHGSSLAVDELGVCYLTGATYSDNFPTENPFQSSLRGVEDAFISKVEYSDVSELSNLAYSTFLGGSDQDEGRGIYVEASGIFVTGLTYSSNFPLENPIQSTYGGSIDAFVTKLAIDGSAPLLFSTYMGGTAFDRGNGIAVNLLGEAYVVGTTESSDFPTWDALHPSLFGGEDVFMLKLNASGSALEYSSYLGGSNDDWGADIAIDAARNALVIGWSLSTDFPQIEPIQPVFGGGVRDAFVAKLTHATMDFEYSTYLGGNDNEFGSGIAVDVAGAAYAVGNTQSADFPTASAFQVDIGGSDDAFVAKIASSVSLPPEDHWMDISIGGEDLHDVFFIDENLGWIVGENHTIFYTTTGGGTWVAQIIDDVPTPFPDLYSVHMYNSSIGWIAGGFGPDAGKVFRTDDGGTSSWLNQSSPSLNPAFYCIDFFNEIAGCAVGGFDDYGVAIRTESGGVTSWDISIDGIAPATGYYTQILRGVSTPLLKEWWAVGKGDTILHTVNSGTTWEREGSVGGLNDFYDVDFIIGTRRGWAVGLIGMTSLGAIIHRQVPLPTGSPWVPQVTGSIGGTTIPLLRGVSFPNAYKGWAVGDSSIIVSTNNGGNYWSIEKSTSNSPNLNAVYFPTENIGYAVGDKGRILKYDRISTFIDINTDDMENNIPHILHLYQNYPNPFNPSTTIKYNLTKSSFIQLIIYDITGREIEKLINKKLSPGQYSVIFNATDLPSGVYIYQLKTDAFRESRKMLLLR